MPKKTKLGKLTDSIKKDSDKVRQEIINGMKARNPKITDAEIEREMVMVDKLFLD